ncbi:MAG: pyridoxal-phosphate dependent enzyme [Planctomycetota bacterium]
MDRALLRRFPSIGERLPWVRLGAFPTPIHRIEGLGVPDLWVKRDDLSGEVYGGNKVRKLELALARAKRRGAARLWVHGALGSNWVVACLLYGQPMGFAVDAMLFESPLTEHARRNFAFTRSRADRLDVWPGVLGVPIAAALHAARGGGRTEYLPPGGSGALSSIGYADAALELSEQVARGEAPRPSHVWVAHGSGGTAAGLLAGFALLEWRTRVCAVQVNETFIANRWAVLALAQRTLTLIGAYAGRSLPPLDPSRLVCVKGFLGAGYGAPTPEGDAAALRGREAGIGADPVYTGKTLAALLARAATQGPGPHLYWHTLNSRGI